MVGYEMMILKHGPNEVLMDDGCTLPKNEIIYLKINTSPLGRKSIPTIDSNNELFPLL